MTFSFTPLFQVKLSDSGMFTCLAWNSLGSEASSAEVRVLELAPTFRKHPVMPNEGMVGSTAVMECQPEGAPAMTVEWLHDGTVLTTSDSWLDPETGTANVGFDQSLYISKNSIFLTYNIANLKPETHTKVLLYFSCGTFDHCI